MSEVLTCGSCGRSWDDSVATSMTPAPSGRCPFEAFEQEELIPEDWPVQPVASPEWTKVSDLNGYEARKHAQKEAEMHPDGMSSDARRAMEGSPGGVTVVEDKTRGKRMEDATALARELMRGDAATFKQGYSFANAVLAACEVEGIYTLGTFAMVAEMLHSRLVADLADAS